MIRRFNHVIDAVFAALTGHDAPELPRCESRGLGLFDRVWAELQHRRLCNRAAPGWQCTRERKHRGPCAAWPI